MNFFEAHKYSLNNSNDNRPTATYQPTATTHFLFFTCTLVHQYCVSSVEKGDLVWKLAKHPHFL